MLDFRRLPREYALFNGQRVAYAIIGEGPTVLLIHGLGGTADFWQPAIERLAGRYRLVVPDLLGFGFSDKPRVRYTLGRHCGALLAVLRQSGAEQCHAVVGHSSGGVAAVALLASGLLRADRLALAAAAYPSPRFPVAQELITVPWFRLLLCNRTLARVDDRIWRTLWPLIRRRSVPDHLRGGWVGFMDYSVDSFYGTAEELVLRADIDPLLARLRNCPTLLLYGANDGTVPPIYGQRLSAALPRSRLAELPANHYAVIHEGLDVLEQWLDCHEPV